MNDHGTQRQNRRRGKNNRRGTDQRTFSQQPTVEGAEKPAKNKPLKALTDGQEDYLAALQNESVVISSGPAGTGKTFMAATVAADMLVRGDIKRIILCRPAVEACDEHLGFLPGELDDKLAPWAEPITDVIGKRIGGARTSRLIQSKAISIVAFAYMRGHTFDYAFVILDEAENTTPAQMRLLLSRIGDGTIIVVNGDSTQSDIHGPNGLDYIIRVTREQNLPARIVTLTKDDIVRSDLCQVFVIAFERDADSQRKLHIVA